jgi:hypothetical protein
MMGDYERNEANGTRTRCADPIPENAFENKRNDNRTPTDENCR